MKKARHWDSPLHFATCLMARYSRNTRIATGVAVATRGKHARPTRAARFSLSGTRRPFGHDQTITSASSGGIRAPAPVVVAPMIKCPGMVCAKPVFGFDRFQTTTSNGVQQTRRLELPNLMLLMARVDLQTDKWQKSTPLLFNETEPCGQCLSKVFNALGSSNFERRRSAQLRASRFRAYQSLIGRDSLSDQPLTQVRLNIAANARLSAAKMWILGSRLQIERSGSR